MGSSFCILELKESIGTMNNIMKCKAESRENLKNFTAVQFEEWSKIWW
jgi:hypothetical protein